MMVRMHRVSSRTTLAALVMVAALYWASAARLSPGYDAANASYVAAASRLRPSESSVEATRTMASGRPFHDGLSAMTACNAVTASSRFPLSANRRARSA